MAVLIHLAHFHALEENRAKTEFVCNGCNEKGNNGRYECAGCGFYLHAPCAKAPKILNKCAKHNIDGHHMELDYISVDSRPSASSSSSSPPLFLTCEFCRSPITSGLFYRCNVCSVKLHMACAAASKLPTSKPQKPQAQLHPTPHATGPPTKGRGGEIAKRVATAVLVGTTVLAVKAGITIASGGLVPLFDGTEFGHFIPDFSDVCVASQNSGTDDFDHDDTGGFDYDGAGDDHEFDEMEFDFGCDDDEENVDNSEDWEYRW